MTLVFAGQSLGKRDNQEDGFRVERQNDSDPSSDVLMLLADGMGGHEAGEVASAVALDAFLQHFLTSSESPRPRERLSASLHRANEAIAERVAEQAPELAGMGCTLIGCLELADRLVYISVGDSLVYLFRQGKLRRLNADHSVYGEMRELVAQGKLSQADADRHPRRNALRSAVVGGELPLIDVNHLPLEPKDVVVLASDGLDTLSEEEVERTIRDLSDASPDEIGAALLAAVERYDRPNQDNTTVLVLRHDAAAPGASEGVSKWVLPPVPASATAARASVALGWSSVAAGGLLVAVAGFLLLWVLRPDDTPIEAPSTATSEGGAPAAEQDVIDAGAAELGGTQPTPEGQPSQEAPDAGNGQPAGTGSAAEGETEAGDGATSEEQEPQAAAEPGAPGTEVGGDEAPAFEGQPGGSASPGTAEPDAGQAPANGPGAAAEPEAFGPDVGGDEAPAPEGQPGEAASPGAAEPDAGQAPANRPETATE